jgi:deazaflavin-dependent oxidoreductase (nitroreductase family)
LSHGRIALSTILTGLPVVVLTTTGARSGQPRTVPLAFIRDPKDPGVFAIIASNFGSQHHPAWYFNLKANPHATCSIAGQVDTYVAHEATREEYDRYWRYGVDTYIGFPRYQQLAKPRIIPIMVLTPEDPS